MRRRVLPLLLSWSSSLTLALPATLTATLPLAGCTAASDPASGQAAAAGVPVVPDAVVDVAFADAAAFVDVVGRFARAGLLPDETRVLTQSGLEAAGIGAPIAVALRAGGDVVVSARVVDTTRFQAALALALPKGMHIERRFGAVDAIIDDSAGSAGAVVALVRARDGVVVVVVGPADPLAAATLIEALGSGALTAPRRTPTATTLTAGPGLITQAGGGLTSLEGTVRVDGDDVVADLHVGVAGELLTLAGALSTTAPPFACAVEEGAAVAIRLPPAGAQALGGLVDAQDLDAFQGRVLLALHEVPPGTPVDADDKATWASLVVAGQPRPGGAASLSAALSEAAASRPATTRTVGVRQVRDLEVAGRPWRKVSAVVDDDVFALSVGAPVVVDRVAVSSPTSSSSSASASGGGSCVDVPGRLLVLDGKKAFAIASRASPELALLRALGASLGGNRASPAVAASSALLPGGLRALAATERLEVSALPKNGTVDVTIRIRLIKG